MKTSKSSAQITLSLVTVLAATITGCGPNNSRVCADSSGNATDPSRCESGAHGVYPGHYWYYMHGRGSYPETGSHLSGGSYSQPAGGAVTRGGFGESAVGHGFGGGE